MSIFKDIIELNEVIQNIGTDRYRMKGSYSIEEIIKRGVQPQVLEAIISRGFLNPETFEMDLSDFKSDDDISLLLDFYIGTIFNSCSVSELMLNILEQELPECFEPVVSRLANITNPYFKYGILYLSANSWIHLAPVRPGATIIFSPVKTVVFLPVT